MYGRLEWVGCDGGGGGVWLGGEEGGEREGRSVLCGHGWCVWEGEGGKKEGEREEATDSIEHQNSHKQSFFFWLGSSHSQN